jgi:hypothetical protein
MNPANSNKSNTNMKKEVPVWRQSPPCHNTFSLFEVFKVKMFVFTLIVYPQSCEAQKKNKPELRSRSTNALIQNEPGLS